MSTSPYSFPGDPKRGMILSREFVQIGEFFLEVERDLVAMVRTSKTLPTLESGKDVIDQEVAMAVSLLTAFRKAARLPMTIDEWRSFDNKRNIQQIRMSLRYY